MKINIVVKPVEERFVIPTNCCKPCEDEMHSFCERIIIGTDQLPAPACKCILCKDLPPACGWCGNQELVADHNTANGWYCDNCDLTFGDDE